MRGSNYVKQRRYNKQMKNRNHKYKINNYINNLIIFLLIIVFGLELIQLSIPKQHVIVLNIDEVTNVVNTNTQDKISYDNKINKNTIVDKVKPKTIKKRTMPKYDIKLPIEHQKLIWDLCSRFNLSYELCLATIKYESNFNPKAVNVNKNGSKDYGLAQLNSNYIDSYAKDIGLSPNEFDPFNPEHSIRAMVFKLNCLKNYYIKQGKSGHELFLWVSNAYNLGSQGCLKYYNKNGNLDRNYSNKVYKYKKRLLELKKL